MRLFSPAKINLFLRVLRKREDGYHDLASLFQAIDLGDFLTFTLEKEDQLTCSDPTLSCDRSNLIWKAVDLFRHKTGHSFGIHVHLEKNIPIQSGLGGGSSNAATTLWALNVLSGKLVSDQTLGTWAAEIGSDISFFFSQGTAFCTGKGEIVNSLPKLPQRHPLWIIKPSLGLSTPLIFKNLDLKTCSSAHPEDLLKSWSSSHPICVNDLEAPSFHIMPTLRQLKETIIQEGFEHVAMTGSGTGFFCLGNPTKEKATNVNRFFTCFTYRNLESWYS